MHGAKKAALTASNYNIVRITSGKTHRNNIRLCSLHTAHSRSDAACSFFSRCTSIYFSVPVDFCCCCFVLLVFPGLYLPLILLKVLVLVAVIRATSIRFLLFCCNELINYMVKQMREKERMNTAAQAAFAN